MSRYLFGLLTAACAVTICSLAYVYQLKLSKMAAARISRSVIKKVYAVETSEVSLVLLLIDMSS
jgi:hypothetical protein